MDEMLPTVDHDLDVRAIVVTDGGRIFGLNDKGVGGMGIPIAKLSRSTWPAAASLPRTRCRSRSMPAPTTRNGRTTRSTSLCATPTSKGPEYEAFVQAVKRKWPRVLHQFEDFAIDHVTLFLERCRGELCMFNDDVQCTAAVVVGTALSAVRTSGKPLPEQRVVVLGGGSAGCGIAKHVIASAIKEGASPDSAREKYYMVDRFGLVDGDMSGLYSCQRRLARKRAELDSIARQCGSGLLHRDGSRMGAHHPHRRLRPARPLYRGGHPRHGPACRPTDPLPLSNPPLRTEANPAASSRTLGPGDEGCTSSHHTGRPRT
jgi:malate dehydrogenase (oxaloacetate-decarboxylating)